VETGFSEKIVVKNMLAWVLLVRGK
jgi:hypothetical protein